MPSLSPQSQAIIDRFRKQPGVTSEQADNLEAAINASPLLIDRFNEAVTQGHLQNIVPTQDANVGGAYRRDTKSIALPLVDLTTAPPTGIRRYGEGKIIFTMAHELEHGFNTESTLRAQRTLEHEAFLRAKSPPPRDYTAEIGKMLAYNRNDEAEAEIAGWNAVVSAVKVSNPNPSLQDIYKKAPGQMADFIDKPANFALRSDLRINPDMTIDPSLSINVEAMGKHYFDKPPRQTALGPYGRSDYANYYGTYAISVASAAERSTAQQSGPILLDMAKLRLSEKLLEENGLDLVAPGRTMPYVDISTGMPGRFDHTETTKRHVPLTAPASPFVASPRGPDDPSHPDHAMLQSIRAGVRKVDEGIGKPYDEMSERVSRCLLAACKDNRKEDSRPDYSLSGNALNRVDHVVLGTNGINIFAVEGRMDDPAHKRCHVSTQEAIQTPVEQSDQKLLAANQAIAQEQQLAHQQALSQQVDSPSRGGMSH